MESYLTLFWQAYLINFLFWSSLAQGSIIFAASLDIMTAKTMHQYVRISRRFWMFLPVTVAAFLGLALGGKEELFPWVRSPQPDLSLYQNVPFFVLRGAVGLTILAILSFIFLKRTKVADVQPMTPKGASPWAVTLVIAFAIIYYYLSVDLVLSLSPGWWSTLFEGYYCFSALFLGAAGLYICGYLRPENIEQEDRRRLSLLLFGFAPFWIYLLWAQYVVMWYGNLPELALVVKARFSGHQLPWFVVTWMVIGFVFVFPFFILLSKKSKIIPWVPLVASISIVIGFMLEKYMLIVPSFTPRAIGIGWIHFWVTLGYLLIFGLSYWVSGFFPRWES
jgi:hypothetical protein